MRKIICVVGARPNFMKIAPICEALNARKDFEYTLIHTGQHYDKKMSQLFFDELGIPKPDVNLGVGGGSHAQQTAEVMKRFEPFVEKSNPDIVIVVGDVNSTLACALVAAKLHVHVAHVEAGLRSGDRSMPEEINRILTDAISDMLFVTEKSGIENLSKEGVCHDKIHFVGNVMIDTLLRHREKARSNSILSSFNLHERHYALVTLHRPSNVDDQRTLTGITDALEVIQRQMPVVFPIHPRTQRNIESFGLSEKIAEWENLIFSEPLGYLEFLCLMDHARIVLTDSGGIQEETTVLGVPCLTLRDNTERPVTIEEGTNRLVGSDPTRILSAFHKVTSGSIHFSERMPQFWDGHAAERIVNVLAAFRDGQ